MGTILSPLPAPAASESLPTAPLAWRDETGYRWAELGVPAPGEPGFTRLEPGTTGVTFSNRLSAATVSTNRLLEIGSGVALGDVDGDGRVDVYFCGLEGHNVLYRNLGHWRFEDITVRAGVACPGQFSTGAVLVDLDGDAHPDLLVNSLGGGTRMFRNDGAGVFREEPDGGLFRQLGATSMALADVEGDGDLDLYVTNYRSDTFFDAPAGLRMEMRTQPDGTRIMEPRERFLTLPGRQGTPLVVERGEPDVFYLNRGGGRFAALPWSTGLFRDEDGRNLSQPPMDWGLAVTFRDLDGDGLPDLYVANDFVQWPDRLWLNTEGRRFRAAPRSALRCVGLSSMAVDVADINRDGHDDLFVADMLPIRREARAWQRPDTLRGAMRWPVEDPGFRPEAPRNTLQVSRGDGTWAELGRFAGVAASDWTPSALFLDVDLDGWEDLLIGAGTLHDVQDADVLAELGRESAGRTPEARRRNLARLPPRPAPCLAFRNRRDLTFEDASARWRFDRVGIVHGFALGDLDDDGDLDVVMNVLNEPARLLRNEVSAPRLAVRLRGRGENTRGIGARIVVRGGPVEQSQTMMAGGRFCSSDDSMRTFAAGTGGDHEIEVRWRSGRRSVVRGARANRVYEIAEENAGDESGTAAVPAAAAPLFEDVADLRHIHTDSAFDDFARQPLLPWRLSTLGPGVAWVEVEADGRPALVVGGGRNGRGVVLHADARGRFSEGPIPPLPMANARDQAGMAAWRGRDGVVRLVIAESSWEDGATNAAPFRVFTLAGLRGAGIAGVSNAPVPSPIPDAVGPLAMADIDGDGDLDLFVGGRAVPGRYPEPARSWLYLNEDEALVRARPFPYRGLASGARFTDVDADGDPDLVLAGEWDRVRIFRNDGGEFVEASEAFGLASGEGWWNGIAAGDFDEDGRLDFVVTNAGLNGRTDEPPGTRLAAQVYYGDFADNGEVQTVMASFDPGSGRVMPWRDRAAVGAAIPSVMARFATHHAYGRASVAEILGDRFAGARERRATTFASTVFLRRDSGFESRPLPAEAQWAPAFGVSVADFDGDGHDDLFLAQNFFGVDEETGRHDAGTGLVLLGDGRGGFRALRPREAGFSIDGEQRGCAVADYDGDGRMDLVVAQHGRAVRMLRNRGGAAGVRVRLQESVNGPPVVGAAVRLKLAGRWSGVREIAAGSGHYSQDDATLVFGTPTPPERVRVRWPEGAVSEWPWPAGARTVSLDRSGVRARP